MKNLKNAVICSIATIAAPVPVLAGGGVKAFETLFYVVMVLIAITVLGLLLSIFNYFKHNRPVAFLAWVFSIFGLLIAFIYNYIDLEFPNLFAYIALISLMLLCVSTLNKIQHYVMLGAFSLYFINVLHSDVHSLLISPNIDYSENLVAYMAQSLFFMVVNITIVFFVVKHYLKNILLKNETVNKNDMYTKGISVAFLAGIIASVFSLATNFFQYEFFSNFHFFLPSIVKSSVLFAATGVGATMWVLKGNLRKPKNFSL